MAIARHVAKAVLFNSQTDFTPIGVFATAPFAVLVSPDHPAQDLRQLAEALRAKSDTPCVTSGAGTVLHLSTVLLMQALADLQSGTIQLYVNPVGTSLPEVRAGRARAIAVTLRQRLAGAPEIPTAAEAGAQGFEAVTWFVLVSPRGLPATMATQ